MPKILRGWFNALFNVRETLKVSRTSFLLHQNPLRVSPCVRPMLIVGSKPALNVFVLLRGMLKFTAIVVRSKLPVKDKQ